MMRTSLTNTQTLRKKQTNNNDLVRTGGKRKKIFQDIYFSVEDVDGIGVLYTKTGEYSAILKIENPVQKYSANIDNYYEFTNLLTALAQTLGEGYAIHKQDVFIKKQFHDETNDNHEFLSESYFRYFTGRTYTDLLTVRNGAISL